MESKPKNELIRITCYQGEVSFDPTGKAKGRGVYLCPREECLNKAQKRRSLQRSLDVQITEEQSEALWQTIREHTAQSEQQG